MRCGLIGERLGHSYSKTLHGLLGEYEYSLWPMPQSELDGFMRARAFDGLNVTIPYKQAVMPYLDEIGETARRIGCVNTVVRRKDGTLFGDNTDACGFAGMARRAGIGFRGEKTLVLGSGGTSLTACDVVREAGGVPVVITPGGKTAMKTWKGMRTRPIWLTPRRLGCTRIRMLRRWTLRGYRGCAACLM